MSERESQLLQELETLSQQINVKVDALAETVKRHADEKTRPEAVREAALAIDGLRSQFSERLHELQELTG